MQLLDYYIQKTPHFGGTQPIRRTSTLVACWSKQDWGERLLRRLLRQRHGDGEVGSGLSRSPTKHKSRTCHRSPPSCDNRKHTHQTQTVPGSACCDSLACASAETFLLVKLLKQRPKTRAKTLSKGPFILTNRLATHRPRSTKGTCSRPRLFRGSLLHDKHPAPWEEVSKRMKILLIQNVFTLLTCPKLPHVTVNKELDRFSWVLHPFAYSWWCLMSVSIWKAWISRRIKQSGYIHFIHTTNMIIRHSLK